MNFKFDVFLRFLGMDLKNIIKLIPSFWLEQEHFFKSKFVFLKVGIFLLLITIQVRTQ